MSPQKNAGVHSPGYVIATYYNGLSEEITIGNRTTCPKVATCNSATLYDIASITKVYTATLIYIAHEERRVDLNNRIKDLDNRFKNLSDVTVLDLLNHHQEIWLDGYLGDATNKTEFYQMLYSARIKSSFPTYLDTHYIILGALLEKIYHQTYEQILQEKILSRLHLECTTLRPMGTNIATNDCQISEHKIAEQNQEPIFQPHFPHDLKSRIAHKMGITTGHAAIFTTAGDLLKFLKSFLECTLLSKETINLMFKHPDYNAFNYQIITKFYPSSDIDSAYQAVIKLHPDLKLAKTYNNMGVRYRNDIAALNDLPPESNEQTVIFSGYTGPTFLLDLKRKIIIVVMCNVLHNTNLDRQHRKSITDGIVAEIYQKLCYDINI